MSAVDARAIMRYDGGSPSQTEQTRRFCASHIPCMVVPNGPIMIPARQPAQAALPVWLGQGNRGRAFVRFWPKLDRRRNP